MFWCEHIYVAFSTIYIGYLTLRRKRAIYVGKKYHAALGLWAPDIAARPRGKSESRTGGRRRPTQLALGRHCRHRRPATRPDEELSESRT